MAKCVGWASAGRPANRWMSPGRIFAKRLRNSSTVSCHRKSCNRSNSCQRTPSMCVADLTSLRASLDVPIPDTFPPPKDEEMETDNPERKELPKCGFIPGDEKLLALLALVKPEVWTLKEKCILVITWAQHLIPKIEDGDDFGVVILLEVLERVNVVKTKVETFQTTISKHFLERGDALAKASKETRVTDYWALVHE